MQVCPADSRKKVFTRLNSITPKFVSEHRRTKPTIPVWMQNIDPVWCAPQDGLPTQPRRQCLEYLRERLDRRSYQCYIGQSSKTKTCAWPGAWALLKGREPWSMWIPPKVTTSRSTPWDGNGRGSSGQHCTQLLPQFNTEPGLQTLKTLYVELSWNKE